MHHTRWFVLAIALTAIGLQSGCHCGGPPITHTSGEGRLVEHGPNGERNEVETTTIDWGAVLIDTRVERKFTVRNVGNGKMEVTEVDKSAAFPVVFNFDIAAFDLDPQSEKELSIFFEPKDPGDYSGALTILLGSSANDKLVINLKARGVASACAITPADTADFGSVALDTAYVKSVKISNGSELDWQVNVKSIISDSDPDTFNFKDFSPGLITVPAHGDVLVPIEFRPNHLGTHQAALTIAPLTSDQGPDPQCQPNVLPLKGEGVDQVLDCEPRVQIKDPNTGREKWVCMVDFGYVDPCKDPKCKGTTSAVTFKNVGNDDITIAGLLILQSPRGDVFDLGLDKGVTSVVVAKGGGTASVPLTFMPKLLGPYRCDNGANDCGKLKFTSNDPKTLTGEVILAGIGGGPAIDVSPARIDFGPVAVDTFQHRRITITNVGTDIVGTLDDNLMLMSDDETKTCSDPDTCDSKVCQRSYCWSERKAEVEVTAGDPTEFSIDWPPDGYLPQGIAAGQSVDLIVKFSAKSPGQKSAKVKIYSNDPANPVTVVEVQGDAVTMPPCQYDIIPPDLNFGLVESGKSLARSFFIRNKSSNASDECLISTLGFSRGTPPIFTLVNGPLTGVHVKGGESLEVPVRFAPKADGTYAGGVEFYISSKDASEGRVALSGLTQKACLMIAPNELDFGVIQVNCSSRDRSFTVYNICTQSVFVKSIDLQPSMSQDFHIVQTPAMPHEVKPGESTDFKVKYSPTTVTAVGSDQNAISVMTDVIAQPYVIPLLGRGATTAIQTDVFAQDPQPKVDVLFVIDNSGSMDAKQKSLADNFASFIKFAIAQQVDYHIATTTTGVDGAHGGNDDSGCDPANPNDGCDTNGCFFPLKTSDPKIITLSTPNVETVFAENVRVGATGNSLEMLIRPAYLALTNPDLTTCNDTFLRDDANLAVVVVSDAADQDVVPVSFYLNAFFNVKGFKRQNMFSFSAINPKLPWDQSTCPDGEDDSAMSNTRVEEVVSASAGVTDDICTTNWSKTLEKLGQTAFGYRTRFFLSNVPDVSSTDITVQVDGVDYPATGPYGDQRWQYNSQANAIDFSVLAVPEPGSTITVSYHVACLH